MNYCNLCPNKCNADRQHATGACGVSSRLKIAKYSLHAFEEPPISGTNGSGTIFFCGCSLKCAFCQNYDVSRSLVGKEITELELADVFKRLEDMGAHNINLVNPTHYANQIANAVALYKPQIPIVWNTHGFESIETLEKVNEFVNVYLTDLKYFSSKVSARYSSAPNYFQHALNATKFMINSKKTVLENDLMRQGVIVRHLILPLNSTDSVNLLTELRPHISDAYLSVMSQYTPFGKIDNFPELKRTITKREYQKVINAVIDLDYPNVFLQDFSSQGTSYIPVWD